MKWSWELVEHLTKRMLYQASVYAHDNECQRYLTDPALAIVMLGTPPRHAVNDQLSPLFIAIVAY